MSQQQYIHKVMQQSMEAFSFYKKESFAGRLKLAEKIAEILQLNADELIDTAAAETNVSKERLKQELERSTLQFLQYASAYKNGSWLIPRINLGKKDLRKTWIPLGPVVVYGASNFPFAYSTPGGDVASALAAGCSVVVKAHTAHLQTSKLSAKLIHQAVIECNLPSNTFQHIEIENHADGKLLIQHPYTAAVGFTGSFTGGKQLFDWANEREKPIPVFSEMGSLNPIFMLPDILQNEYLDWAKKISFSITNSAGQFCTKPGLIFGIDSLGWNSFKEAFAIQLEVMSPTKLLHDGILKSFREKVHHAGKLTATHTLRNGRDEDNKVTATLHEVTAAYFMETDVLKEEVFGPYCLLITCKNYDEFLAASLHLNGGLTATIIASTEELKNNDMLIDRLQSVCGRIIHNDVPTGVVVEPAMLHGGPFPATTDSRFTAVGSDAVARFVRPITYQNWKNKSLPDELKNENPLELWRMVNGQLTKNSL